MRRASQCFSGFCAGVLLVALAPNHVTAQERAELPCKLECDSVQKRSALVVEYELCGFEDSLRSAASDDRIVTATFADVQKQFAREEPTNTQSPGQRCIDRLRPIKSGRKINFVLPKTATREDKTRFVTPNQAMGETGFGAIAVRTCLYGGIKGHLTLTSDAMDLMISKRNPPSTRLVARAAELADDYAWSSPPAHAQSQPNQSKIQAIRAFKNHLISMQDKLRAECLAGRDANAAYVLGQLLHSVQDLATHAGITNQVHSTLMWNGRNPDAEKRRIKLAATWSEMFLGSLKRAGHPFKQCLKRINELSLDESKLDAARRVVGHKEKDFGRSALVEYVASGLRPAGNNSEPWWGFDDGDASIKRFFKTTVLDSLGLPQ